MDAMSYSKVRANLAKTMEQVCEDHTPVIITRQNSQPVVMLSLADYQSIEETAYLLCNPHNAKQLALALAQKELGQVVPFNIDETDV